MKRTIALLLSCAGLASCATLPPLTATGNMCKFRMETSIIDDPLFDSSSRERVTIPKSALIMSGGGEKGAFGAGYLKQWAINNGGKLPEFDLVTGISTGAILATWAFVGDHEAISREYAIRNEAEILKVNARPGKAGGLGLGTAISLLRKNSLGDLAPLRERLRVLLDPELLGKVAAHQGSLVVGAVDVDYGELQLFDLKDMANRAVNASRTNDTRSFERFRDCYVDAIVASSSVPVGAKPVFIDNRMYVDGGVRQGVFVEYMSEILSQNPKNPQDHPAFAALQDRGDGGKLVGPKLYVIMNGTQWASRDCGKLDETGCELDNPIVRDGPRNRDGQHKKWQIANLAFRTTDILSNQIYRLTAKRTDDQYKLLFPSERFIQNYHFTRMHRSVLKGGDRRTDRKEFVFTINGVTRNCPDWRSFDQAESNPLQFHPNYMACLQAFGADQANWDKWHDPATKVQYSTDL